MPESITISGKKYLPSTLSIPQAKVKSEFLSQNNPKDFFISSGNELGNLSLQFHSYTRKRETIKKDFIASLLNNYKVHFQNAEQDVLKFKTC